MVKLVQVRASGGEVIGSFGVRLEQADLGLAHSLVPCAASEVRTRIKIGGVQCAMPYEASYLNISALAYGALSDTAIEALSAGARLGGFLYNTGEAGIAPSFFKGGGDLCWQIGTAYFGCRTKQGRFDAARFSETASSNQVRMIELKLSQGAKPALGGLLLADKVTREVAEICGIPANVDSYCPAAHAEFTTPLGLLTFLQRLRELSGGKPVGFKLCVGRRRDILAICKAMLETDIVPDFITVDDAAGGSGAAPIEFSTHVGLSLNHGLVAMHDALRGVGLRDRVRLIATGGVASGFDIVSRIALGADLCAAGRAFMLALGCVQALACESNVCPTGIATQDPRLSRGLVPRVKAERVAAYQRATIQSFAELVGTLGYDLPERISPRDIVLQHGSWRGQSLADVVPLMPVGALLEPHSAAALDEAWSTASARQF